MMHCGIFGGKISHDALWDFGGKISHDALWDFGGKISHAALWDFGGKIFHDALWDFGGKISYQRCLTILSDSNGSNIGFSCLIVKIFRF